MEEEGEETRLSSSFLQCLNVGYDSSGTVEEWRPEGLFAETKTSVSAPYHHLGRINYYLLLCPQSWRNGTFRLALSAPLLLQGHCFGYAIPLQEGLCPPGFSSQEHTGSRR